MSYHSQVGQDQWIESLFPKDYHGYFLEIGSDDGVGLNNSYYLEKNLGWKGVCVEPNPEAFKKLSECRGVPCLQFAVDNKSGVMPFTVKGMLSTIVFPDRDNKDIFGRGPNDNIVQVKTITPTELLEQVNAPSHIDYFSLDTEGNEFSILEAFPWDKYSFFALTVEHNANAHGPTLKNNIYNLLTSKGYRREKEDVGGFEDWYLKT